MASERDSTSVNQPSTSAIPGNGFTLPVSQDENSCTDTRLSSSRIDAIYDGNSFEKRNQRCSVTTSNVPGPFAAVGLKAQLLRQATTPGLGASSRATVGAVSEVAGRPVFTLDLGKLNHPPASRADSSGAVDLPPCETPKSTRRQVSRKLSKFIDFFEKSAFVKASAIEQLEPPPASLSEHRNDVDLGSVDPVQPAPGCPCLSESPSHRTGPEHESSEVDNTEGATFGSPSSVDGAPVGPHEPPKRLGSVRDIIRIFDPAAVLPMRHTLPAAPSRGDTEIHLVPVEQVVPTEDELPPATPFRPVTATTAGPNSPQGTSLTRVASREIPKWQAVEKRVAGALVGTVWRKWEVPSLVEEPIDEIDEEVGISDESLGSSDDEEEEEDDDDTSDGSTPVPSSASARIGRGSTNLPGELTSAGLEMANRSVPAITPGDGGVGTATPVDQPTAPSSTKLKRASHFVAIRIEDEDVVDSIGRFQQELLTYAPFLSHCASNSKKFHLTLLVLSLGPDEIEGARQALVIGVQRFMTVKASLLGSLRPSGQVKPTYDRSPLERRDSSASSLGGDFQSPQRKSNVSGADSEGQQSSAASSSGNNSNSVVDLELRTVGAFGTRVLFVSPPLHQRLLLQAFHVELARAFGEAGISIVGAGSGWTPAMEMQKQVRRVATAGVTTAGAARTVSSLGTTAPTPAANVFTPGVMPSAPLVVRTAGSSASAGHGSVFPSADPSNVTVPLASGQTVDGPPSPTTSLSQSHTIVQNSNAPIASQATTIVANPPLAGSTMEFPPGVHPGSFLGTGSYVSGTVQPTPKRAIHSVTEQFGVQSDLSNIAPAMPPTGLSAAQYPSGASVSGTVSDVGGAGTTTATGKASTPTGGIITSQSLTAFPGNATALDKALLKQYDLSSARTTLYIPQITVFKVSKAAKRQKNTDRPQIRNLPKLKLFPRLYHNLVQRVLQSGLPQPRLQPSLASQHYSSVALNVALHHPAAIPSSAAQNPFIFPQCSQQPPLVACRPFASSNSCVAPSSVGGAPGPIGSFQYQQQYQNEQQSQPQLQTIKGFAANGVVASHITDSVPQVCPPFVHPQLSGFSVPQPHSHQRLQGPVPSGFGLRVNTASVQPADDAFRFLYASRQTLSKSSHATPQQPCALPGVMTNAVNYNFDWRSPASTHYVPVAPDHRDHQLPSSTQQAHQSLAPFYAYDSVPSFSNGNAGQPAARDGSFFRPPYAHPMEATVPSNPPLPQQSNPHSRRPLRTTAEPFIPRGTFFALPPPLDFSLIANPHWTAPGERQRPQTERGSNRQGSPMLRPNRQEYYRPEFPSMAAETTAALIQTAGADQHLAAQPAFQSHVLAAQLTAAGLPQAPGALQTQPYQQPANQNQCRRNNGRQVQRRVKVDKILTTSTLPKPPFGTQKCFFVELLEMSQMDPDGYYKRICRVKLSKKAEFLDDDVTVKVPGILSSEFTPASSLSADHLDSNIVPSPEVSPHTENQINAAVAIAAANAAVNAA